MGTFEMELLNEIGKLRRENEDIRLELKQLNNTLEVMTKIFMADYEERHKKVDIEKRI